MRIKLQPATAADVPGLVSLRNDVNRHLASNFAGSIRASGVTEKGICFAMSRATVFVALYRGQATATLALSTRKPWSIDASYFSPTDVPLYLTDMAVHPRRQRHGIGRLCIVQAIEYARRWPSTALRLDAYDAQYGAGGFYRKCGFRETGRAVYRQTPLIYFEFLLSPKNGWDTVNPGVEEGKSESG